MRGSTFPAADDSVVAVNEQTTIFSANVLNEWADMAEAIERFLGINPASFADLNWGDQTDVATALLNRLRFEIGEYTHLNSDGLSKTVTFANARFTTGPRVFLFPRRGAMGNGDDTIHVLDDSGSTSPTTTQFVSLRNTANGTPSTADIDVAYLALEWNPTALVTDTRVTVGADTRVTVGGDTRTTV